VKNAGYRCFTRGSASVKIQRVTRGLDMVKGWGLYIIEDWDVRVVKKLESELSTRDIPECENGMPCVAS
jgi:hypothetical protein